MTMAQNQPEKLHAACDECRTRKLKCSGESPKCSRCTREDIRCVYSAQKQMGRPRKRRREDADGLVDAAHAHTSLDPSLASSSLQDSGIGSTTSGSEFAQFGGLVSPPEFDEFAGFDEFGGQANGAGSSLLAMSTFEDGSYPAYTQETNLDMNFASDSSIDPSLWTATPDTTALDPSLPATANVPCTCLSIMYLSLSDLQSLSSFAFPAVIPPLRGAVTTALTIVRCEKCPKDNFSAIQNVQGLSSLLSAIAERYHKVIAEIDAEAERLERTGEKKPFRIGDNSAELRHLHTGTPDCPMGFDVKIEAKDWKKLAKKALKTEVLGGGCNATPFKTVLDMFEERQNRWHVHHAEDAERKRIYGAENVCKPGDALCVKMIGHVRRMVENLNWD